MRRQAWLPAAAAVAIGVAACSTNPRPEAPAAPPSVEAPAPPAVMVPPAEPVDQVAVLIKRSEQHFANGQRELAQGYLEQARHEFDEAIDLLLGWPGGARSDPRLREHFDRLVDRINALEATALAQGDGFTENPSEPAKIDELLEIATFPLPLPAYATEEAVEADLQARLHDIPIPLNAKVLSYVELFQARLRDFVQEALQRGARYLPMIQAVFRAEGLPLDLAYVPLVESAFKPNARSRAQAKGVWQFMRRTALENGLKHDWYIDERADPEKATQAAARYLKTLYSMLGGDWHLALASYNGGPGRVQRAMKRSKLADYWELSKTSRYLPRETREYVPMILAAIIIARNPAQYGFEVMPVEPLRYEKVTLPHAVDVRRVAEWIGVSVEEIQTLNPELRRWITPIKDPNYDLKVPIGTAYALVDRLENASPSDLVIVNEYIVRRGDTLSSIGQRLKVGWTDIAEANDLTKRSIIRPGQRLLVPGVPGPLLSTRRMPQVDAVSASGGVSSERESTRVVYLVRRGDSLFSIARTFDTTVDSIKSWNDLGSDRIGVGDRLTIYTTRPVTQQ